MPDSPLVIPFDVEKVLVDTIDHRHEEHLRKAERLRGVAEGTFEKFATVVRMSDDQALRLAGDTVPACLLGVIGAPDLVPNEDGHLDAVYQLGMQVTVMGQKRRDTLYRRDVMAWTTVECLLQRTPRGRDKLINSIRLVDYEPLAEADTQRTLGDARMVFEVGVANALSITGGFPVDDSDWPPDGPVYSPPTIDPATYERIPLIE